MLLIFHVSVRYKRVYAVVCVEGYAIFVTLHHVPRRIQFKLGVTVHRCLQGNAPKYLVNCCKSITDVASRQRLRSASRHQLILPRYPRTNFGRRAFSVAGLELAARLSVIRRLVKTLLVIVKDILVCAVSEHVAH